MEKIRRSLKIFFATYGSLLFQLIAIIAAIILFIQWLNNQAIEKNKKEIDEQKKYQQEELVTNKEKELELEEKKYIEEFIEKCNTGKIEEAYSMLADECKQEKYNNIDIFKNEYVNKVFVIDIEECLILRQNDNYIATLTQNALKTGRTDSKIEEVYKIYNTVLERKIYICNK